MSAQEEPPPLPDEAPPPLPPDDDGGDNMSSGVEEDAAAGGAAPPLPRELLPALRLPERLQDRLELLPLHMQQRQQAEGRPPLAQQQQLPEQQDVEMEDAVEEAAADARQPGLAPAHIQGAGLQQLLRRGGNPIQWNHVAAPHGQPVHAMPRALQPPH